MKLNQQAADRLTPPGIEPGRYHPPDELLAFLLVSTQPSSHQQLCRVRHPQSAKRPGLPDETQHNYSLGILALPGNPRPLVPVRSYLDSAAAHGITALDAIRSAITGKPWLPPLPAIS